eukprot:TRINITY_DN4634_c0_g1_i1.p1 TRINITY_DN4634_c0_g1~~TRINITY_DN4634_c0_g1_i1.p1  ORF type:complete len:543 (-),score=77.76 TRINITY_DN4634_c0_g1_i1:48-1676(-)
MGKTSRKNQKVSCCTLTSYAAVSLGIYANDLCYGSYLTVYLLDYAKVAPIIAGIILAAGEITEVIASFLIGQLSDSTKSEWGPRRPWILAGSILGPIFLTMTFVIPPEWFSEELKVVYYFVAVILTSFSYSVVSIPHQALGPELTESYNERLKVSSTRSIFSFIGMLSLAVYGFILFNVIYSLIPETLLDWVWVILAAFPSFTTLLFGIICVAVVTRTVDTENLNLADSATLGTTFCSLLGLVEFDLVVIIFSLAGLIQYMSLSMLAIFTVHVLGFPLSIFTISQIVMMAFTVLTVFILKGIAKQYEKRTIMAFGCVFGAFTYIALFYIPGVGTEYDMMRYGIFPIAGFMGVTNAIIFTIPNAMMGDVTDLSLFKHKRKQEGFMFSAMEILQSVIQASAAYLINYVLDTIGYVSEGEQPEDVKDAIRYLFCVIPVASLLIVWVLSALYPLNKKKHSDILRKIKKLGKKDELDLFGDTRQLTVSKVSNISGIINFETEEEEKLAKKTKKVLSKSSKNLHTLNKIKPKPGRITVMETLTDSETP